MPDIVDRLMEIVHEVTQGAVSPDPNDTGHGSIRRLGLNSVTTLSVLVAIEDAYGIEWDDEVPEEALGGFEQMAQHIRFQLGLEDLSSASEHLLSGRQLP